MYHKDVLDFYELDEKLKAYKKEQVKSLPRSAAVVAYGNSSYLLDAAQYVELAWYAILDGIIKNAFNKSELLTLRSGADEEAGLMADLMRGFKTMNIPRGKSTTEKFMHLDDKNNKVSSKEILDDVNEMLETMRAKNDNLEDGGDHTVADARAYFSKPEEGNVNFSGFELM